MEIRIQKWGNSSGIRIPSTILKSLNIKVNDKLNVEKQNDKIVISKPKKHITFKERLKNYDTFEKPEPFDWGEKVGKEIW